MLPSFMSSNAGFRSSATATAASPAPTDAVVAEAAASGSVQEIPGDAFAGQLNDAIVGDTLMDTQPLIETPVTETPVTETLTAATAVADATNEPAASAQAPAEPSAEEWLLAMLDQQLLQLEARDTAIAAAPIVMQAVDSSVQVNVAENPAAVEKFSTGKSSALMTENSLNKTQINPAADNIQLAKTPSEKVTANSLNTGVVVNSQPNADARSPNNNAVDNSAWLNNASATAINASLANSSSTTAATELSHNSNLISPAAVNAAGESNIARAAQTQSASPAPEAKWGEQLLHTLRDQVQVQIQQKIQSATIRLDPPELGSLEIYLSHESGRLTVNITASQADVARLIQTTSDRLRQELAGPQFTQVHVQTSADGQSGQQQSRERQRFFGEQQILANDQSMVGNSQSANRSGDVLVTV